jgi:hypothetical protein
MYDTPNSNTAYIGIATNKTTSVEGTNPSEYTWSKFRGDQGVAGTDGAYFEYRYAKNGSATSAPSLSASTASPSGWTTTIPSVGALEYLWMTVAKKSAAGALLQNWSTPVRTNGVNGVDGVKGDKGDKGESPALVFRGVYSSSVTYYGNSVRVDAVKYNNTYYVARIDAGEFANVSPTSTSKWNGFGATFESVATGLLLAELAYIENLVVGRLSTGKDDSLPRMISWGSSGGTMKNTELGFYLNKSAESSIGNALIRMGLDVGIMQALGNNRPGLTVRGINGDGKYSEITSAGIFTNGGNIRGLPGVAGTNAFSIAALLQNRIGTTDDPGINAATCGWDQTNTNYNDPNKIPAVGYGGLFNKLCAYGLYVGCRVLTGSNATADRVITETDVFISMNNQSLTTIYLPLPQAAGKLLFVRINNSSVTINGNTYSFGRQIMLENGSLVDSTTASVRGELVTLLWDGSYWLYSSTAK